MLIVHVMSVEVLDIFAREGGRSVGIGGCGDDDIGCREVAAGSCSCGVIDVVDASES